MAHAYEMPSQRAAPPEDDPVLKPYAELEAPGSLYVSGLAVLAPHRGRGIGTALMNRVDELAETKSLPRISLICFERNDRALAFYLERGFKVIASRPIVPHPSLHYQDGDALLLLCER